MASAGEVAKYIIKSLPVDNLKLQKLLYYSQAVHLVLNEKTPLFPRPVYLEHCTMETPKGYETDILTTLKAFNNSESYRRKTPHKLEGKNGIWSLDVSSRSDKYRMLFYVDNSICKITHLCTEETHK